MRKIRRELRNPRLIKIRKKLVFQLKEKDELFNDEIADIFRVMPARISQILNEPKVERKNNK